MIAQTSEQRAMHRVVVLPLLVLLCTVMGAGWSPSMAGDLAPNGSFEAGAGEPESWHDQGGGRWVEDKDQARHGTHYLSASQGAPGPAWRSDTVKIRPSTDYRLEGWLRARSGKARIELQFLDAHGKPLGQDQAPATTRTPAVENAADWRYVAVEGNSGKARAACIVFHASGEADLDQVSLAPIAVSYIGNPGVEKDDRGRIGFWERDVEFDVIPAQERGGSRRPDEQIKHEGLNSVLLEPKSADHHLALATLAYDNFKWTNRVRLTGWARCQEGASAHLAACWVDGAKNLVRVDLGPESTQTEWHQLTYEPPVPPEGAVGVRLVAVARGGPVWFDQFDLEFIRPDEPLVRIFVNQVGYNSKSPKSAVIATNFFPCDGHQVRWNLRNENGNTVDERTVDCSGRVHSATSADWGWYFWRADFSSFQEPGGYTAVASASAEPGAEVEGQSPPIIIRPEALLDRTAPLGVEFFFVQRCGFEVPGWHGPCHLDDVKLPDGTHLDATGGWHSAGDYNKPMYQFGDSAAVFALAVVFDEHRDALSQLDRDQDGIPDALDEAWWGAKFLAKMQKADGSLWGDVMQGPGRDWMRWTAPDNHTDNEVGTADDPVINKDRGVGTVPLAVAGWVRLATLLDERSISNDYLERALRLWEYSTKDNGGIGNNLLFFGALELHNATGEDRFKDYADKSIDAFFEGQRSDGSYPGDSGDHGDWTAAAMASYALRYPDDPRTRRVRDSLMKYLEFCLSRTDRVFGLTLQAIEDGKDVYFHPTVSFGVNFWVLGRAWAAALIHRLTGAERALAYAIDQIDWVFGKNPTNLCMFEGRGVFNPPRYHHRYNQIPGRERGAVPGAIANGFVQDMGMADRPGFDLSTGGSRPPSYRTSEPFLVHNVTHLLAISALPSGSAKQSTEDPPGR